jgi:hypothetical protein
MDRVQIKVPYFIILSALLKQGFILCAGVGYLYKKKIGASLQIHQGVLSKRV